MFRKIVADIRELGSGRSRQLCQAGGFKVRRPVCQYDRRSFLLFLPVLLLLPLPSSFYPFPRTFSIVIVDTRGAQASFTYVRRYVLTRNTRAPSSRAINESRST